ncbi:hypothetical protein ARMSODRAFT_976432 [Armillaria solidipes]|uniref:Uncharacterized protein n=1 Tax=Armillaria solidipes TaxID=1076256 RepID=A0A2H3BKX9_9AGAR|nr:hypothetical protein ARMSODRAFT_976432 [Armillaria solidipes]
MDNDQNGVVSMVCQDNARRQDLDGNVDNRRECQWRYESGVARFANGLIRRDQINNGRRLHDIVLRYVFGNPEDSEIWSERKLRDMTENHCQTVKEGHSETSEAKRSVKNIAGIEDEMGRNKKQLEVAVKDQGSNLRFRTQQIRKYIASAFL